MFYTVVNINFYWYLPQKLLLVIIISRFLGPKLQKILRIFVRSFVNSHPAFSKFWISRRTTQQPLSNQVKQWLVYVLILFFILFLFWFDEKKDSSNWIDSTQLRTLQNNKNLLTEIKYSACFFSQEKRKNFVPFT